MIEVPKGLIQPDCVCFKDKTAERLNKQIDAVSAILSLTAVREADNMRLCKKAREYYMASIIWTLISMLLEAKPEKENLPITAYNDDLEAIYDRLKPLVMQRMAYVDAIGEI